MAQELLDVEDILCSMILHGSLLMAKRVESDLVKPSVLKFLRQPLSLPDVVSSVVA